MAIIWDTRNNGGGFGGDYTNGAWSSFMNTYAIRFTAGLGLQGGGAFENVTFTRSYSVNFPYNGVYSISANADNSGTLNIGGIGFTVGGFSSQTTTNQYFNAGTYTLTLSVTNAANGPSYQSNPYGIAVTVDAPSPIFGCTDPSAINYNSSANVNDGSCVYPDPVPDNFSFTDVTNANTSTYYVASTTITGINVSVTAEATSPGQLSLDGVNWSSSVTLSNNQTLYARLLSSPNFNNTVTTSIIINSVIDDYTVTTINPDQTPDAFSFTSIENAPISTQYYSSTNTTNP